MITLYFILKQRKLNRRGKVNYVKITSESEQICKDAFNVIYPDGYFKFQSDEPANYQLTETFIQTER